VQCKSIPRVFGADLVEVWVEFPVGAALATVCLVLGVGVRVQRLVAILSRFRELGSKDAWACPGMFFGNKGGAV